jgi:phosphoesterase RecJ-like protein
MTTAPRTLDDLAPERRALARAVAEALAAARRVTVSTHVNADGDGAGCQAALAHALRRRGAHVALVNPTPYPESFAFLVPEGVPCRGPGPEAARALAEADLQIVVDTSEPARLGPLAPGFDPERTLLIDHHPVGQRRLEARHRYVEPAACATGELVYDVLCAGGVPLDREIATALYVAVATDTGSFRYSNTTPRAHRLAAAFLECGVEPEAIHRRLYATVQPNQLEILRAALESLQRDPEMPVTWLRLPHARIGRYGELDDWEPIIDPARNLAGTEVAVFLRELGDGTVKVSLRSNGRTDVAGVAHALGGGGHDKAAGAVVEGSLDEVAARIRALLRPLFPGSGP